GDPAFTPPPSTDQRGFPRVVGGRVDIGAFEVLPGMTIVAGAGTIVPVVSGGTATFTASPGRQTVGVEDLRTQLVTNNNDIVIDNGTTGGDITWQTDAFPNFPNS